MKDLTFKRDADGTSWLIFTNPSGKSGTINLTAIALARPPITQAAILEWCERQAMAKPVLDDSIYGDSKREQAEGRRFEKEQAEELIEQTVDKIDDHATIHDYLQVGHCVREAIISAFQRFSVSAFE